MTSDLVAAVLAAQQGMQLLRTLRGGDHGQRAIDSIAISNDPLVPESILGRLSGSVFRDNRNVPRRMAPSRVHKASSAESILAHVLRQRSWTARYRDGRLSGKQRLALLEDVRQYGRQWLRHEAEVFFGRHGDGESIQAQRAAIQAETGATGAWNGELRTGTSVTEKMGRDGETSRSVGSAVLSPLKRWFDRMRQFVRELIFAGTMALKGGTLDAQETAEADRLADVQDAFFGGFQREITVNPPREIGGPVNQVPGPIPTRPPMSPKQATARAEKYGDSVWGGAQRINRTTKLRNGTDRWERLVLGKPKTHHCEDCPPDAALGWVPVGTLRPIGDRECENLCLCHIEYSDSTEKPSTTTPLGPVRKPALKLRGSQEAIDKLLADPQFNEAMKRLNLTMRVHVGEK